MFVNITRPRSSGRASFESAEDQEDSAGYSSVQSKVSAIAHSIFQPQKREQKILAGLNLEQLQKVAALAQQGATGTFTFDTVLEHERKKNNLRTSLMKSKF
ncbi:hypothetical protein RB195_024715 [Necator americanus]|uniref:Uncharacterized protein n=1 Tax=Necator americanus TaxID=51031 RepID=A0ABR1EPB1_NECAM